MSRNVPKLRFKGFEDEWEKIHLSDRVERVVRKNKGNVTNRPLTISAQYGLVNQEEFFNKVVASKNLEGYYLLNNGEFAYNKSYSNGYPFGAIKRLDKYKNGAVSTLYICFKPKLNVDSDFLTQYFESSKWYREVSMVAVEGARNHGLLNIGVSDFFDTIHRFPSLQEQEKIANFLSKVDSIIEKQEKKVEYWNSYKKGMMQKIFSQKIRFKDENGRNYPEWEKKNLKYVLSEISEKTKENNQYEVLSSTANGVFKQSEYFNREIASADNTGYKILRLNQIVLSPQNLWLGNINYNNKYDMGIVSPSYKIFNINKNLNEKYISYIIKTDRMLYGYKQASEQGASVVRRNLNMDLFYDILINIPCVEEQEKIANFLSNIDNIIEKESKKLEELKQWKKGLLQQMFV
ncbi:TPA: restriction endonuclease subunit S [Clostridium perfringens]